MSPSSPTAVTDVVGPPTTAPLSPRVQEARRLLPRMWSGEDVEAEVESVLQAAIADGDADGECAVLYVRAAVASAKGDPDANHAAAAHLVQRAQETTRPLWESVGRHYLARLHLNEAHEDLALNELILAEVLTDDAPENAVLISALNGLAATYSLLGLYEDGERVFARMTPLVRATGDRWTHEAHVYNRLLNQATWSLALLRVDEAEALANLEHAVRLVRAETAAMGTSALGPDLEALLLYADLLTGSTAMEAGTVQLDELLTHGPVESVSYVHCALAHRLAEADRMAEARQHVADGLARAHPIEGTSVTTALLWARARIASLETGIDTEQSDVWAYAEHATAQVWELRLRRVEAARDRLRIARLRREHEDTSRAALEDPLTGVANRRRLSLERAAIACAPAGESVAVAYIDIDEFKQVNDTLGHGVGDAVLQALAALLVANTRDTDVVSRYGGDEFVILARRCEPDAAHALADRVLGAVRGHDWSSLHPDLAIRVTLGVAVTDRAHELLFDSADAALYAAKRAGRDQAQVRTLVADDTHGVEAVRVASAPDTG